MTFDNPILLLTFLLLIPIMGLWMRAQKKRGERMRKFSEEVFQEKIWVGNNNKLRRWHFILFFLGLFFLFAAFSGPTMQGGKEKVKTNGIDMMFVIDISNSMRAKDIEPSRLERAKLALSQTISRIGEDRIGIVVFAGESYSVLPLTNDQGAAQLVLESVSPDMLSMQGTAIGDGIEKALNSFVNEDKESGKAIVVISDGENHEDDAVAAAAKAVDKGVIVCTIGMGSPEGAKIPLYDANGNFTGNKLDEDGKEIVTKLDEENLKSIAEEGKGMYIRATTGDVGVDKIYSMLQGLSKSTKETWRYTSFIPLYRYFLVLSILFFLVEIFLPSGNRTVLNSKKT